MRKGSPGGSQCTDYHVHPFLMGLTWSQLAELGHSRHPMLSSFRLTRSQRNNWPKTVMIRGTSEQGAAD
jgi:hypothetical protein